MRRTSAIDRVKRPSTDPLLDEAKALRRSKATPRTKGVDEATRARIHRVRFVKYAPSAVASLALTPSTWDPTVTFPHARRNREVLAVGRGNGNIEIHVWIGIDGEEASRRSRGNKSQKQAWIIEKVIPARLPSAPVDHLVFTHQASLSESDIDLLSSPEEIATARDQLSRTAPRLFSSSGASILYEWDWVGPSVRAPKASIPSGGGNIWSVAANPGGTMLAVGCEDGIIRLVSLLDGDFEITRRLDKVNTRLHSIAWGPGVARSPPTSDKGKRKEVESPVTDLEDDVYIVAGGGDSTLRKWDLRSGRCIARLQTDRAGRDHTLVWSVAVLGDHTIVSGDSMGTVTFWDGVMGTQQHSYRAHKADILCLAVSADGRHVYTSGIDQMTAQFSLLSADNFPEQSLVPITKWFLTSTRRLHNHDVRALVHSPSFVPSGRSQQAPSSTVPILISGGIDMSVTLTPACSSLPTDYAKDLERLGNPLNETASMLFDRSMQRKIPYLPQRARAVHVARDARLLVSQYHTSMAIWRLSAYGSSAGSFAEDSEDGWQKCCEMSMKGATNLVTSAVSADGKWLALSDGQEARLFQLSSQADGTIEPRRIKAFQTMLENHPSFTADRAAAQFAYTSDSRRLIMASALTSHMAVIRLPTIEASRCEIVKVFSHHAVAAEAGRALAGHAARSNGKSNGVNGHVVESEDSSSDEQDANPQSAAIASVIACLAVSDDNQWLASADMSRRLHVFHLDSLQHQCALPSPELPPASLAFIPLAPSQLIVGLPNNTLQVFDVESRQHASWAKSLVTEPVEALFDLREPLIGLALEPISSRGSSSASASPLPSPMHGLRGTPRPANSSSPSPRPRIPVLIAWGATWLCRMRLTGAITMTTSLTPQGTKRKAAVEANGVESPVSSDVEEAATISKDDVQVSFKYQPLLALDFLGPGELVVVERPMFSMVDELPLAYVPFGKYGT